MTNEERQERIEGFRKILLGCYDIDNQNHTKDVLEYLENGGPIPTFHNSTIYKYGLDFRFGEIVKLLNPINDWDKFDERVIELITASANWNNSSGHYKHNFLWTYLKKYESYPNIISWIQKTFKKYGLSEKDEYTAINNLEFFTQDENQLTDIGYWVVDNIEVFRKHCPLNSHRKLLKAIILHDSKVEIVNSNFLDKLFGKKRQGLLDHYFRDIVKPYKYGTSSEVSMDIGCVEILLKHNAEKFENYIENNLTNITNNQNLISVKLLLVKYYPQKYESKKATFIKFYILNNKGYHYPKVYFDERSQYSLTEMIDFLFISNDKDIDEIINKIFSVYFNQNFEEIIKLILKYKTNQESLAFLMQLINFHVVNDNHTSQLAIKTAFKCIGQIDFSSYLPTIIEFTKNKSKKIREMAAITLSKLGERIIPEANKLLNDKKGEVRQIGALILSLIKTDESQRILLEALDNEKNDDARDVILESLSGILPVPKTEEDLRERIEKAHKRGKLDSPIEKWLDESQLPTLKWLSGKAFTSYEIRYLFYRQSRTKDIRIDSEAKPMLALIDKSTSHDFASALLKTYFTNGADAKQKYCLGLGAILGGDDECNSLKSKVTQWADAGRGKMAEYAVKALALNGSTKALRAVEFFSRKYKNKNKNIGAAANEAFVIVAEDLNISPYELADSIIPDFGFDGLFKEFEVDGETYRAFIDNDFKLAYLNEDNKVLKSLPRATTNELKEEFKEIGKEIKDIVKSQSSRLEQYLVIQRKWNTEKWQAFFMGNPVMFAYAVRLIWGIYDADNQLIDTFRCQEDQTLINAEGDELELPEDTQIGMVHPISLTAEQITYWTENLYEDDIQPIFPQLTRPVIVLNEKDKNFKISREFQGVQYGGYGFISKMEKIGWNRGSVVDGGWISSYFKDFSDLGFTAIITQQGELCVGYYDGNAELNELMFVRKKAVQFGSYVYDEPSNENDERLMAFGEVPAIIYSEVMADMQFFKENDLKKQNEVK